LALILHLVPTQGGKSNFELKDFHKMLELIEVDIGRANSNL
jgi:hypothetical protein